MDAQHGNSRHAQGLSRRDLLKAGLAAGVTLSAWPLYRPASALGGRSGTTQARRHPARARV